MSNIARRPGFVRNALANWLAFVFSAVVSFFLSPFVVNHLGSAAYGVWILLGALVGYLGLLDFGIRGAVTRHIAHHYATANIEQCSSVASAALTLYGVLGLLAIGLAAIVSFFLPMLFHIPDSLVLEARIVLCIGGITIATALIGAVFGGAIAGLERFDIVNGVEIVSTTLRALLTVIALWKGYGLVALALIQLFVSIIAGLASWMAARRLMPAMQLQIGKSLPSQVRTLLSFSMVLSALHILGALINYSAALIIAAFLPISLVTMFAIAANLCDYARQVASTISTVMMPRISALMTLGSSAVGTDVLRAMTFATLVTAPIGAIFLVRGQSFIELWMGPEFAAQSGSVLRVLAFGVFSVGARQVAISSIIGMSRHRVLIPLLAAEAATCLVLSIALVHQFELLGVALGILIPSVVVNMGFIPRQLSRLTGVALGLFYRDAWLLPLVACVPFAIANVALETMFPARTLLAFFAQIGATLPLVVVVSTFVCLTGIERRHIAATIMRVVSQVMRTVRRK